VDVSTLTSLVERGRVRLSVRSQVNVNMIYFHPYFIELLGDFLYLGPMPSNTTERMHITTDGLPQPRANITITTQWSVLVGEAP
jgi:hypothetical protein